jgi:hypothetical protein
MLISIDHLLEKDRIKEVINNLFIFTDNRDWESVEKCFAEKVHFDMTSMGAGSAVELEPRQITDMLDHGLKSIEAIHHQTGNFKIDVSGEKAVAFCYGIASHFRKTNSENNTRTFVGSYNFHLVKDIDDWKIDSLKFNPKYIDGNVNLEEN